LSKTSGLALVAGLLLILSVAACMGATPSAAPVKRMPAAFIPLPEIINIGGPDELPPSTESIITCTAIDYRGHKLNYIWSVSNGSITGRGSEATWTTPEAVGTYTVNVKITDDEQNEASLSRDFRIVDKTLYFKFVLPSDTVIKQSGRARIWSTSDIQCSVLNEDPGGLSFKWSSPDGKLTGKGLEDGRAMRVQWTAPGSAGRYKVYVAVTDRYGYTAKGEAGFEVVCCGQ
jgi:hypothetical protein